MAGVAGSRNPGCGHSVQPGSRFCTVCGEPATASAEPSSTSPAAAPLPQRQPEPWDSWYAPRRTPPPPSAPQPWPAPPGGVRPPPADPEATRVDGLDPVPPGDLPTAMFGDLRQAPQPGR